MRLNKIGFEWESRIPRSSFGEDGMDAALRNISDVFPSVRRWHNDGNNREFECEPQPYHPKEWKRFEGIQEVCKEFFGDEYQLKSLHCHIDCAPNIVTHITNAQKYLWKNIFYLTMPIAWIIRASKQTSLLDAGTQWVNISRPTSKGLLCVHGYGYYNYGLELRFAGKFWKEYIPIVDSIDSLLGRFNFDIHTVPTLNGDDIARAEINKVFQFYPESFMDLISSRLEGSYLFPNIFNNENKIWKHLYTDIQLRKGSAGMISLSLGFMFLLPYYKNYFPKTVKYLDDYIIPNFEDIMLDKVRKLKKNYKYPFLRAWKDIAKDLGKYGHAEINTALTSLRNAEPIVDVPDRHVICRTGFRRSKAVRIPNINIDLDYKKLSNEIEKKNWRFTCKYANEVTEDRNMILRLCKDICLKLGGYVETNVCCVSCPYTRQKNHSGEPMCDKQCNKDCLRADVEAAKSKWKITDLSSHSRFVYPYGVEFCVCHNCNGYCPTCTCKDCNDKFDLETCNKCGNKIRINAIYWCKVWNDYSLITKNTVIQTVAIMSKCPHLVIHTDFGLYQCTARICNKYERGRSICCYSCQYSTTCREKCTRLGDHIEFHKNLDDIELDNKNMDEETRQKILGKAKIHKCEEIKALEKQLDDLSYRVLCSKSHVSGTCDSYCNVRNGEYEKCSECENRIQHRCLKCRLNPEAKMTYIRDRVCDECDFEKENGYFMRWNQVEKKLEIYCNDIGLRRDRRKMLYSHSSYSSTSSISDITNKCVVCNGSLDIEHDCYILCNTCGSTMHDDSDCAWFCNNCGEPFCPSCESPDDDHRCRECNARDEDDDDWDDDDDYITDEYGY